MSSSIRHGYETCGVKGYYEQHGQVYRNPHYRSLCQSLKQLLINSPRGRTEILRGLLNTDRLEVLDLACGAGEGTQALLQTLKILQPLSTLQQFPKIILDISDPYTLEAFHSQQTKTPLPTTTTLRDKSEYTFQDMSRTEPLTDKRYDMTICSYALHLAESCLFGVLYHLAMHSRYLVVASPHKKPVIDVSMGWQLVEHVVIEKVHSWLYKSLLT